MKFPKTWITIALFCLLAAAPYLLPALERFRILDLGRISAPLAAWKSDPLSRIFLLPHPLLNPHPIRPRGGEPPVTATEPLPPSFLTGDYAGKNWPLKEDVEQILAEPPDSIGIEDYGCSMDHFYRALAKTEQKQPGAITRISHFGDSPISGDLISGAARTLLQDHFGDSGHGYILLAKPWDFYYHEGIRTDGDGWKVSSPVLPGGGGGAVGLGGASFTARSPSAFSLIRTAKSGEGSEVSRFDIFYLAKRDGGSFLASVDNDPAQVFFTAAETANSAMVSIPVEDGGHAIKIKPKGDGPVTLYGVALERTTPGVVYDTLGMLGGTVHHLTLFHEDTWTEDLRNRRPDLVILNFGTNESNYGHLVYADYLRNYSQVIQRIHTALPWASVMVMSPMDRGTRNDDGDIVTIPSIPVLVAAQQRVARGEGVAFFNTFAAMGGMGTMARWYDDKPRLVTGDFTHPTYTGAQQVGTLLVNALMKGFAAFKQVPAGEPCTPPGETVAGQAVGGEQLAQEEPSHHHGTGHRAAKRHHRRHAGPAGNQGTG